MPKKEEVTPDEEIIEEEPVSVVTEVDPMENVPIILQRDPRCNETGKFVSVNNMKYFVPYGKQVYIPRCVAEILIASISQDNQTAMLINELTQNKVEN